MFVKCLFHSLRMSALVDLETKSLNHTSEEASFVFDHTHLWFGSCVLRCRYIVSGQFKECFNFLMRQARQFPDCPSAQGRSHANQKKIVKSTLDVHTPTNAELTLRNSCFSFFCVPAGRLVKFANTFLLHTSTGVFRSKGVKGLKPAPLPVVRLVAQACVRQLRLDPVDQYAFSCLFATILGPQGWLEHGSVTGFGRLRVPPSELVNVLARRIDILSTLHSDSDSDSDSQNFASSTATGAMEGGRRERSALAACWSLLRFWLIRMATYAAEVQGGDGDGDGDRTRLRDPLQSRAWWFQSAVFDFAGNLVRPEVQLVSLVGTCFSEIGPLLSPVSYRYCLHLRRYTLTSFSNVNPGKPAQTAGTTRYSGIRRHCC